MLCDGIELERDPQDKMEFIESGLQRKLCKKPLHLGKADMLHFNLTVPLHGNNIATLLGVQALKEGDLSDTSQIQVPYKASVEDNQVRLLQRTRLNCAVGAKGKVDGLMIPLSTQGKASRRVSCCIDSFCHYFLRTFFCMQFGTFIFLTLRNYFSRVCFEKLELPLWSHL